MRSIASSKGAAAVVAVVLTACGASDPSEGEAAEDGANHETVVARHIADFQPADEADEVHDGDLGLSLSELAKRWERLDPDVFWEQEPTEVNTDADFGYITLQYHNPALDTNLYFEVRANADRMVQEVGAELGTERDEALESLTALMRVLHNVSRDTARDRAASALSDTEGAGTDGVELRQSEVFHDGLRHRMTLYHNGIWHVLVEEG